MIRQAGKLAVALAVFLAGVALGYALMVVEASWAPRPAANHQPPAQYVHDCVWTAQSDAAGRWTCSRQVS